MLSGKGYTVFLSKMGDIEKEKKLIACIYFPNKELKYDTIDNMIFYEKSDVFSSIIHIVEQKKLRKYANGEESAYKPLKIKEIKRFISRLKVCYPFTNNYCLFRTEHINDNK